MSIAESLTEMLSAPTPECLWRLRAELLEAGVPPDAAVWSVVDQFYHFLNHLGATADAREHSHYASKLDVAAMGGVALGNLLGEHDSGTRWQRLLVGGLSEGLMVLASRQYVRAAESEMAAVYGDMAWFLHAAYWWLSIDTRPDTLPSERRAELRRLLAPLRDPSADPVSKVVLIGLLMELLLVERVSSWVDVGPSAAQPSADQES